MRSLVRNVLYARLCAVSSSFSILAAYPFAAPANVAECARVCAFMQRVFRIVYMQAFSLGRPEYSFSLHTHTRKKLCIVYASNIHATFRSSSESCLCPSTSPVGSLASLRQFVSFGSSSPHYVRARINYCLFPILLFDMKH